MNDPKRSNLLGGRDDVSTIAEWRIVTYGCSFTQPHGSNFRNHQTGESVLPTEVFVEFVRSIRSRIFWIRFKFILLLQLLIYGVFLTLRLSQMRELVDKHRQEFIIFGVEIGFFHDGSHNSYVWLGTNQSNHHDREVVVPASQPARQEEYPPIFLHLLVPGDIHVDEEEYHPSMIWDQNTWTLIKDTHTSIMSINDRKTYQPMEIVVGFLVVLFSVYTVLLVGIIEWWGSRNAWIGFFALLISLIGAVRSYSLSQIMAYQKVTEKVNQKLLEQPKEPTMMGYLLKLETSALPFRSGERSLRYQLVRMGRNGDSPSTKLDGVTVDDFCVV